MAIPTRPSRSDRGVLGVGRSPGMLGGEFPAGRQDGLVGPPQGVFYARADKGGGSGGQGSKGKGKAKAPGGQAAGGREITIVGNFKNPFRSTKDEVDAIKNARWEPSVDDFAAVGGNVLVVDTFEQVFAAILAEGEHESKAGSIKRINIFTHANPNLIAFSGTIRPLTTSADVGLRVNGALSVDKLDNLTKGVTFRIAAKSKRLSSKTFTLDDVRKRFAKDAVLVIYACHSGLDSAFLQQIADTFQVKVRGFKSVIGYFPSYNESPPSINRRRIGVGAKSSATPQTDFHNLDASSDAVEKKPRSELGKKTQSEPDEE